MTSCGLVANKGRREGCPGSLQNDSWRSGKRLTLNEQFAASCRGSGRNCGGSRSSLGVLQTHHPACSPLSLIFHRSYTVSFIVKVNCLSFLFVFLPHSRVSSLETGTVECIVCARGFSISAVSMGRNVFHKYLLRTRYVPDTQRYGGKGDEVLPCFSPREQKPRQRQTSTTQGDERDP